MRVLVVLPTYNEAISLTAVLTRLFALPCALHLLVVDDASPDGTADLVRTHAEFGRRLFLLPRAGKLGLGSAYRDGFRWALDRTYSAAIEMDADLSHDPNDVPRLLAALDTGADLAIGSRYVQGISVVHWPLSRLLLSLGAGYYTRFFTGLPLTDPTSGFKCFRRRVLETIPLETIRSNGYAFQIELSYQAWLRGFRVCEIPITFSDREAGHSKMSGQIVREALWMVWRMAAQHGFRRRPFATHSN